MAIRTANNQSLTEITEIPSAVALGGLVLLETKTASGESDFSFTSGIDSTYKEYIFKFINIHGSEDQQFKVTFSTDGGSSYGIAKTTTYSNAYHTEAGSSGVGYNTSADLANSTSAFNFSRGVSTDNDENSCGTMHLYDPSSTTFVKHFYTFFNELNDGVGMNLIFPAGYVNTTSAIDAVKFEVSTGTVDAGTLKMYGVT